MSDGWMKQYPSVWVTRKYDGAKEYAKTFYGEGNKLLYQLKNLMTFRNLGQLKMERRFTDGTVIIAKSVFGHDEIYINSPSILEEEVGFPAPCMVTYDRLEHKLFFKYSKKTDSTELPRRKYIDLNGVIERFADDGSSMMGIQLLSPVPWFCEAGTLLWMQGSLETTATYRLYKYLLTSKVSPVEKVTYGGEEYERYNFIYNYDNIDEACPPLSLSYNNNVSGVVSYVRFHSPWSGVYLPSYDFTMTVSPRVTKSTQIPQAIFIREYNGGLNILWDIVGRAKTTYSMTWGGTILDNDPNPPNDPVSLSVTAEEQIIVQHHVVISKNRTTRVINTYGLLPLDICVIARNPYMQINASDYPASDFISSEDWAFFRYYPVLTEVHNVGSGFYKSNKLEFLATYTIEQHFRSSYLPTITPVEWGLHYYNTFNSDRTKVNSINGGEVRLDRNLFMFSPFVHYGTDVRLSGTVLISARKTPPLTIDPCAHFYYINGQFYEHEDMVPIEYMNPVVYPYGSQIHSGVLNTDIEALPIKSYYNLSKMPNCDITYASTILDLRDDFNLIGQMDGYDSNSGSMSFEDFGFPYRTTFRLCVFCSQPRIK